MVVLIGVVAVFFKLGWEGGGEMIGTTQMPVIKVKEETPQTKSMLAPVDQTASWKQYTNEKYGFSFKYTESLMPGFSEEELSFNQDQYLPGARSIMFSRNTTDPLFLKSGAKTFPGLTVDVLPKVLEAKYASICAKQTGMESEPLMMPCPPLKIDVRNERYVFYFNNFIQDPPKDILSDAEIELIRSTLKAF